MKIVKTRMTLSGNKEVTHNIRTINNIANLKVLYTNVDGLVNKRYDLKILLQSLYEKPDVIAITEFKPKKLVTSYKLVSLIWKGIIYFTMVWTFGE